MKKSTIVLISLGALLITFIVISVIINPELLKGITIIPMPIMPIRTLGY